jgi:hypothetical protein
VSQTPEQIAAGLSEAQKRALLAFSNTDREFPGHYAKAKELGVSGNTLRSLYGLAGADPETLELGPILVVDDYTREGTFWEIQPLGLAVRAILQEQAGD